MDEAIVEAVKGLQRAGMGEGVEIVGGGDEEDENENGVGESAESVRVESECL